MPRSLLFIFIVSVISAQETEYFQQNQISIMMYKRNIAIGSTELDVTDAIIDELNKKLPSVKLN